MCSIIKILKMLQLGSQAQYTSTQSTKYHQYFNRNPTPPYFLRQPVPYHQELQSKGQEHTRKFPLPPWASAEGVNGISQLLHKPCPG